MDDSVQRAIDETAARMEQAMAEVRAKVAGNFNQMWWKDPLSEALDGADEEVRRAEAQRRRDGFARHLTNVEALSDDLRSKIAKLDAYLAGPPSA